MDNNQSNIQKKFSPVTVDSVGPHTLNEAKIKAGILNVQLRQTVETIYPSVGIKGDLFGVEAFNVEGKSYTSTRVTWIDAPANTTQEQIEALLAAKPNARIASVMSNNLEDVLNAGQKAAIANGQRTREEFEQQLRVKDTNGNDLPEGPNGERQYRNYSFAADGVQDVDLRTYKGERSTTNVAEVTETTGSQAVI